MFAYKHRGINMKTIASLTVNRDKLEKGIHVSRDQRMGRCAESYGEDPTLAATMGALTPMVWVRKTLTA